MRLGSNQESVTLSSRLPWTSHDIIVQADKAAMTIYLHIFLRARSALYSMLLKDSIEQGWRRFKRSVNLKKRGWRAGQTKTRHATCYWPRVPEPGTRKSDHHCHNHAVTPHMSRNMILIALYETMSEIHSQLLLQSLFHQKKSPFIPATLDYREHTIYRKETMPIEIHKH
jgi:hypothetical protein